MADTRVSKLTSHLLSNPVSSVTNETEVFGKVGVKSDDDVVIVSALRTPIGRAKKGSFKDTTPDDLLLSALKGILKDTKIDPKIVNDIEVGNVQTIGAYSMPARTAMFRAGFSETSCIRTVNRQCSSGLQAVASIAADIKAGYIEVGIGAGVESMTNGGNPSDPSSLPPMNLDEIMNNKLAKDCLIPMGITSETVAERYGITREEQDKFSVISHERAINAQKNGLFKDEIIPTTVKVLDNDGKESTITVDKDDGPREGTNLQGLAKLKPAFKPDGSTTAGNASQVSDGAAAVLLMKRKTAKKLGLKVLGTFRGFKVAGVLPDEMGVGPAVAIPALLESTNLTTNDISLFELNEAFASQALYCIKKLKLDPSKVNVKGGAIALGHPLGTTGARQVATLLHELKRDKYKKDGKNKSKVGVISMCIGTGMGAAGLFEAE